jgi:hypothetical protein
MSLHRPPLPPSVPEETARVARAAFPKGNPYLTLRDDLGPVFADPQQISIDCVRQVCLAPSRW